MAVAGGPLVGRDGTLLWGLLPGLHPCGASTGWEMGEELPAKMRTSRRCSRANLRGLPRAVCHRGGSAQRRWQLQHSPASNPQTSTASFELEQIYPTAVAQGQAIKQGSVVASGWIAALALPSTRRLGLRDNNPQQWV